MDTTGSPSAMDPALAADLVTAVRRFHDRGWCLASSGNYSVVVGREPLRLLLTRSGIDKGRLDADDLMLVDERARMLAGRGVPSAEGLLHATLAAEARAGAVLHTHSVWGTLAGERYRHAGGLVLRGYEMLKAFEGRDTHEGTLFVPVLANTQDMGVLAHRLRVLLRARPDLSGFLIAGHGLYAWGADLATAVRHLEAFEFLLEVCGRSGFDEEERWPS